MEKKKRDAKSFQHLDVAQMTKINGGKTIEVKQPDGTIIIIEI